MTPPTDPVRLHKARGAVRRAIAVALHDDLQRRYDELSPAPGEKVVIDGPSAAKRTLRNVCLGYLASAKDAAAAAKCGSQFVEAAERGCMTDKLAAFQSLVEMPDAPETKEAVQRFYDEAKGDFNVINKWFAMQALADTEDSLQRVEKLMEHPDFTLKNPNRLRSVVSMFVGNVSGFHKADGSGYAFMAKMVLEVDKINPQVASRMALAFSTWAKLDAARQALVKEQLGMLQGHQGDLSKDTFEVVSKVSRAACREADALVTRAQAPRLAMVEQFEEENQRKLEDDRWWEGNDERGQLAVAERLLGADGGAADANAADGAGECPLHLAAARGDYTMVKLLLERGANAAVRSRLAGKLPEDCARERGHTDTATLLARRAAMVEPASSAEVPVHRGRRDPGRGSRRSGVGMEQLVVSISIVLGLDPLLSLEKVLNRTLAAISGLILEEVDDPNYEPWAAVQWFSGEQGGKPPRSGPPRDAPRREAPAAGGREHDRDRSPRGRGGHERGGRERDRSPPRGKGGEGEPAPAERGEAAEGSPLEALERLVPRFPEGALQMDFVGGGEDRGYVERETGTVISVDTSLGEEHLTILVTGPLLWVYAAHCMVMKRYHELEREKEDRARGRGGSDIASSKVDELQAQLAALQSQLAEVQRSQGGGRK
ncbi:unnamed protein product [Prorocentrum cordatum]|uniref:Peptidase M1 alanyl aminopeptidase C-terminal domain-containing protein n=1 Tax=Prorocentrum cordatum TaxID=2364126 RepID=A0ABN9V1P5_9DINO|nr:unnamed protein product [Polarella glacialis]